MKEMNVGVLGATGAVGQEMLKILAERDFPVRSVRPLASARSAGKTILFKGETVPIVEAKEDAFRGLDLVLGGERYRKAVCAPYPGRGGRVRGQFQRFPAPGGRAPDRAGDQPGGRQVA